MIGQRGGRRPLSSYFTPLARASFFVPAFLLLLFLVIFPVLQTIYLSFVFTPTLAVTFGENADDTFSGVMEDAGVRASDPDTNYDAGVDPTGAFPVHNASFLWLRIDLAALPATAEVESVRLVLFSASHNASGELMQVVVAGADETEVAGNSWSETAATWNAYDGVTNWTAGSDGGAGDRDQDFRILPFESAYTDGYYAFVFAQAGVSYVRRNLGAEISLQVYGRSHGHDRAFSLSEALDGQRPYLLVTFTTGAEAVGLQNYADVLGSKETVNLGGLPRSPPYGTLVHNLLWIAIHLPMTLFTGLILAILLQEVKGSSLVKSMIFLGMVTPMIVGGVVLRFLFDEKSGIVPVTFGLLGVESLSGQWLAQPSTLLFGLIFGSVWLWTGFSLIVYSAGLTTIPKDYFEAAKIDGASAWQTFTKITWPLLRPITLVVVTMTVLWELKIFDIVIAATNVEGGVGGAADVMGLQMFRYWQFQQFNDAAVVATLLTLLTLVFAIVMFRRVILGPGKTVGLWDRLRGALRRKVP